MLNLWQHKCAVLGQYHLSQQEDNTTAHCCEQNRSCIVVKQFQFKRIQCRKSWVQLRNTSSFHWVLFQGSAMFLLACPPKVWWGKMSLLWKWDIWTNKCAQVRAVGQLLRSEVHWGNWMTGLIWIHTEVLPGMGSHRQTRLWWPLVDPRYPAVREVRNDQSPNQR